MYDHTVLNTCRQPIELIKVMAIHYAFYNTNHLNLNFIDVLIEVK